jgi:PAS domain S-box-containing protein
MNGPLQRKPFSNPKQLSDAYLRTMMNSVTEPAILINNNKLVIHANEAMTRLYSKSLSQIIDHSILDLFTPIQTELFQLHFEKAVQTKNPIIFESMAENPSIFNFLLPFFDGEGLECLAYFEIGNVDQSNKKPAMTINNPPYQFISDSILNSFITYDEEGICVYANQRFAELIERSVNEIIGRPIKEFIEPEQNTVFTDQIKKQENGIEEISEIAWVAKSGRQITTIFSPKASHDTSGKYSGGSATLTDISGIIEASRNARQQLSMLTTLYTGAQELSKSLDMTELSNRMVRSCVDTFGVNLAWLGQAKSDGSINLITSYPIDVNYPQQITVRWDDTPEGRDASGQAIQKNEPVIFNDLSSTTEFGPWIGHARKAGFWSHAAFPLVSHERSFGVLSLFSNRVDYFTPERIDFFQTYALQAAAALENARLYQQVQSYAEDLEVDYAERTNELQKRVAEVEELNKALALLLEDFQASNNKLSETTKKLKAANTELESFSYSVSHDLKAPLRGIDGYSRLLMDEYQGKLDDEGRVFLENIRKGTQQMSQLIDDLLAYSRLERRSITSTNINPKILIEALLEQREREIKGKNIKVSVQKMCTTVQTDYESLSQAIRNLIDNAIKFTQGVNNPEITLGGYETENACVIWVRDNGIGFDMQFHDRIFEIFQRLHTNDTFPGTGVGLAIVRKALQHMGGRVWAESEPGKGATFFLEIPFLKKMNKIV